MIAHDEPNRPFNLPPTIFTISDGSKQSSESKALPVAQLKVKIAPIILIPIPPVPERIYGGKIEECLHVTVAIGARVKVNVDVQEDGLELLGEDPRTFEEVHTNIVGRLQALLLKNSAVLGLDSVTCSSIFDHHCTDLTDAAKSDTDILILPTAANPIRSPMERNMIPSGALIAYLDQLNLTFSWVKGAVKQTDPDDEEDTKGIPNPGEQDQDEDASDNGEGEWLMDPEEIVESQSSQTSSPSDTPSSRASLGFRGVLPNWAAKQIDQGCLRVLRQHLLRRFPAVFDGGAGVFSQTFQPHRSISESVHRMLGTASRHELPFPQSLLDLLIAMRSAAIELKTIKLQMAATVPVRKKKCRAKKAGNLETPRESDLKAKDDEWLAVGDPQDDSFWGRKNIATVMAEAFGRIGMTAWEDARAGRSRLSYGRLQLLVPETVEGRTSPVTNDVYHAPLTRSEGALPLINDNLSNYEAGSVIVDDSVWMPGETSRPTSPLHQAMEFDHMMEEADLISDDGMMDSVIASEPASPMLISTADDFVDLMEDDESAVSLLDESESLSLDVGKRYFSPQPENDSFLSNEGPPMSWGETTGRKEASSE